MSNSDKVFKSKYKGDSYIEDYELFMSNLSEAGGQMAGGEVGEMIAIMAAHYIRHNLILARTLKMASQTSSAIYSTEDGGKPISAAKASILADATPEAAAYQEARVHVQNIETTINALKALQKGILNEYSHSAA